MLIHDLVGQLRGRIAFTMHDALLLALGELIDKEISAPRLLERVVEVMASVLAADRCTIFLVDRDRSELVSVAAQLPELEEIRMPLTEGGAGFVARTGRVLNVPYCDEDVRFWPDVDEQTGYTTRTMLAGPLRDASGQIIGVVQFLNKQGGIFTDADEKTLAILSEQAAALLARTTLVSPDRHESAALPMGDQINRVIGCGPAMQVVFRSVRKVAPTEATVLLRGESGTGKGLIAKALHHNSLRAAGPMVHIDCTTLPDGLMENELFGHERGAYTGADATNRGKVEAAAGGTLFLDEVGDLPLGLQSKLLTLLQDRTYSRVGGAGRLTADIRIIAATNRDLEAEVAAKRFREDLYYRLRVVQIELPPLRDRGRDDLRSLVAHFLTVACRRHKRPLLGVRADAMELLLAHRWPGNVRELENCLESAVIFADGEITPSSLPLPRPGATLDLEAVDLRGELARLYDDEPTLRELEGRYLALLLERHNHNRSACARILGIGRNTLLRKIREQGLG